MKKIGIILTVMFFGSFISNGQNNRDSLFTTLGYSTKIESKYLNQTKTIYVHLPFKFDKDKEYPLIVLADFMAFKPLSSTAEIMAYNQTIPWCIVVCPVTTNVREDYSPIFDETSEKTNGGKTIEFYENELLPFLQSKYKISKKILWGQNFSGMFSTFVMLSKPDLFDGYFSDIPQLSFIENIINSDTIFKNIGNKKMFYYLTGSSLNEKDNPTKTFLDKLKNEQVNNFKWQYLEQSDSIFIAHILTNYIYGLDSFFKEMKE